MQALLFCSVLLLGANGLRLFDKQLHDQWSLFKHTHKKHYSSRYEENYRRAVWEMNLVKIQKHNHEAITGVHTYTLSMNQFGDLTHEEFKKKVLRFNFHIRNNRESSENTSFVPFDAFVPRAVDWRKEGYVTSVKDQGSCGASWAFSAAGALEGQHIAQTKQLVPLSVQNLIDCSDDFGNSGCNGGFMDASFQYIQANGLDTELSYPYEGRDGKCRFNRTTIGANSTGYRDIQTNSEPALTYAIAIVGPISVAIDASRPSFQFYHSGVYDDPQCLATRINHGALVVGFNETDTQLYYIVKNSWGTSWGMDGYIWMSRNKNNQCGIASLASYPRFA